MIDAPGAGPGGAHASTVQSELGLTTIGFGVNYHHGGSIWYTRFADDFVVATPGGWSVTAVTVLGLTSGEAVTLEILDGPPWDGGVALAGGSAAPNCINAYRLPPGQAPRRFCERKVSVNVDLAPGHYWVRWLFGAGIAGQMVAPVTIAGQVTTGDGRTESVACVAGVPTCTSGGWQPALDQGTGTAQGFPFVVRGRPASAVKGNFDAQASPDIVLRNVNPASSEAGRVKLWLMNGPVRTGSTYLAPDPPGPEWRLAATDDFDTAGAPFNGPDARTDVLFQHTATGKLVFWLLDGSVRVGRPLPLTGGPPLGPDWVVAAAADFDGDARPDLLWRDTATGELRVWTLAGTAFRAELIPSPSSAQHANWQVVAAQDYSGDGWTDLLWYNTDSGRLVLWFLDASLVRSSGLFTTPPSAGDANWRVVASADFSATGAGTPPLHAPDVLWRNADSGLLVIWHLDFAGNRVWGEFTQPPSEPAAIDWQVVGPR